MVRANVGICIPMAETLNSLPEVWGDFSRRRGFSYSLLQLLLKSLMYRCADPCHKTVAKSQA